MLKILKTTQNAKSDLPKMLDLLNNELKALDAVFSIERAAPLLLCRPEPFPEKNAGSPGPHLTF